MNKLTVQEAEERIGRANIKFVTAYEIADLAGVTVKAVYEWTSYEDFPEPPINKLRTRRWRLTDVIDYLANENQ